MNGSSQLSTTEIKCIASVTELVGAPWPNNGDLIRVYGYSSVKSGGGGLWLATASALVTPNGIDIIQSVTIPDISYILQVEDGVVDVRQLGALGGNDISDILNRAQDISITVTITKLDGELPFLCSKTIFIKKSIVGINMPELDFFSSPSDTNSFFTGDSDVGSISIKNIIIRNSQRVAIIGRGNNTVIECIEIKGAAKQGINWQGNGWIVKNCVVSDVKNEFGILNGGVSDDVLIENNRVYDCVDNGAIELGYVFKNVRVSGNYISNCRFGIQCWPQPKGGQRVSENIDISNNVIKNCSNTMIHCKNEFYSEMSVSNLTIKNNNLYGGSGECNGIYVQGARRVSVANNEVCDILVGKGVLIDALNEGISVAGNNIFNVSPIGIEVGQDNVKLVGNMIDGSSHYAYVFPAGNDFGNVIINGGLCANIGVAYVHNFSYRNYRNMKGNSFTLPFTSVSQFVGVFEQGYREYQSNATPGSRVGWVCTVPGIAGSTAVFKSFGHIEQ